MTKFTAKASVLFPSFHLPTILKSTIQHKANVTMASIRKETAASRAAVAKRRQRAAASVSSDHSRSINSEPRLTVERPAEISYPMASTSASASQPRVAASYRPLSTTTTTTTAVPRPVPASARSLNIRQTHVSGDHDQLLERSHDVANEAASVLASVRKTKMKDRPVRYTEEPQFPLSQPVFSSPDPVKDREPPVSRKEPPKVSQTSDSTQYTKMPAQKDEQHRQQQQQQPQQRGAVKDDPQPQQRGAVKEEKEEEEKTIEELEPLVFDAILDASCLPWTCEIRIRANAASVTLQAVKESSHTEGSTFSVHATGLGLGQEEEVMRVFPVVDVPRRPFVCYGDSVILRSEFCKDQALAFRSVAKDDGAAVKCQLGFFPSSVERAAGQWAVLRATRDGIVRVGQVAVERATDASPRGPTAPVRSGDAILLRNRQNGGLLALVDGTLKLVTDSYNSDQIRNGSTTDPSLFGRLQRHEKLVPSAAETFHLLLPNVPPTPLWVNARGMDERLFLSGSYLFDSERNQVDPKLERSLFGGPSRLGLFLDYSGSLEASRTEQIQTPQGQEQVLLDEVLGSFLGLEGHYIRTKIRVDVLKEKSMDDLKFELVDSSEVEINVSLRSLVEEILPLSTDFVRVSNFVSSHLPGYEYGSMMQSLCETMDRLVQDYVVFISGLEQQYRQLGDSKPSFTMRELLVLVQPSLHAMSVLRRAIEAIRDKKGGALVNALRELKVHSYNGDAAADRILGILLDNASVPYMDMLRKWLECGVLSDPSGEFMIEFHSTKTWDEKYTIRTEHVLAGFFSTKVTVERVLATGRFWNALLECHDTETRLEEDAELPAQTVLRYTTNAARVSSFVQTMYHRASRSLVRLLLEDCNLLGSLRLMKRYFLLDQGDFFVHFLDAAEDELLKDLPKISRGRIQHWLGISVQLIENLGEEGLVSSSSRNDRWRARELNPADLRCRFASESLMDHLDQLHSATGGIATHDPPTPLRHTYGGTSTEGITGLDAFLVDFASIPFPLSLVLSQPARASYQLLFRNLFFAKHAERRLVGIWQDHQAMKELQSLRGSLGPTFLLRQRMLHFLQNLIYYMMFEVIEPSWLEMEESIASPSARKEQTVDDILHVHNQFLQNSLEACLLTNRDLLRALTKLMTTCLLFSDQMKRFMKATKIDEDREAVATEKQKVMQRKLNDRGVSRAAVSRRLLKESMENDRIERLLRVQKQTARVERELSGDSYKNMIARFDEVFSDNLREFVLQLTESDDVYHTHKVNLCIRLDYNGYVTGAMGMSN
jgi:gamma-tubulin complex component 2